MKALIFLMLFAPLSSLFAQDWTYFGKSKYGNKQYFKLHSEAINTKKIWIKEEGNNLKMVNNKNKIVSYAGYNLSLYNVDCVDRKLSLMQVDHYNLKDDLLQSSEGYEFKWIYMSPGSLGDMVIDAACKR
jgi:hypothetical protein